MDTDRSPVPGAVGLIGLGEIGQVHAAAVRRSRTARLVAVADTAPELLAPFEAQGIRGYRDAGQLIADAEVGTARGCSPTRPDRPRLNFGMMAGCSEQWPPCAGTRSSQCWARTWTPAR